MKIVLASDSPRRRSMLGKAGLRFSLHSCPAAEKAIPRRPGATVRHNAEKKARAAGRLHPSALIISADTIVYLRRILGKPRDLKQAEEMLLSLSGKIHRVYSAVAVYLPARGLSVTRVAVTRVKMKKLDRGLVRKYFRRVNPLDKAGAYAVQEHGGMLVEGIRGSLTNVIGLPLEALEESLKSFPGGSPLSRACSGARRRIEDEPKYRFLRDNL